MWRDDIKKRFSWAKIERGLEKVLYELVKAEEEEDAGVFLLMMHYDHASQPIPFRGKEKKKIMGLLRILIKDSQKHQKMLQEMIEKLEKRKGGFPCES